MPSQGGETLHEMKLHQHPLQIKMQVVGLLLTSYYEYTSRTRIDRERSHTLTSWPVKYYRHTRCNIGTG